MNIFVTDPSPYVSAQVLPDKHIVKMPLETCQMLSIVCSEKWGHGYGEIHRLDGQPYKTEKGAFRNHPCTVWANECLANTWWLLSHGFEMCKEYTHRYGKTHSCENTLLEAGNIIPFTLDRPKSFVFAGPDEFKHDKSIDLFTKYQKYIASKPWTWNNYLRDPSRRPDWLTLYTFL